LMLSNTKKCHFATTVEKIYPNFLFVKGNFTTIVSFITGQQTN